MAHTTKRTLSETLKKILQEKSLDKVTVVDIVETSAINRQTFYYHFKDIYDLVEWTFLTDNTQSLSGKRSYKTWQQGYLQIFDYVKENKNFVKHVYYSDGREILTRFLYDINERADGIVVDEEDKAFIAHFYKYGFVGLILEWIENGMKEDPKRIISHLDILTHGDIDKALGRLRTDRKLDIELRRG